MAMAFSQQQRASQIQAQRMSQKQIQSLNLLSMPAADLREEILSQAENNPALEIVSDSFESGLKSARYKLSPDGNARVGSASSAGEEKSNAFQEILESRPDERKSLFSHLSEQLGMLSLDEARKALCQKIIGNLDSRGFYILAPASLIDRKLGQDEKLLEECLNIVQSLDPPGVCAENVEKSLLLQARLKGCSNKAALFLLDGRLDFLNPPQSQKILEKIQGFLSEREKLSFATESFDYLKGLKLSDVERALDFIKSLDPIPARDFSQESANYIFPDIYIERAEREDSDIKEDVDYVNRIVYVRPDFALKIKISDRGIPCVRLAPDFGKAQGSKEFSKAAADAKNLLEALAYRESAMAKAACAIAKCQAEFFEKGPGHLLPLKMQDIADKIGAHESTVSRMASSKYIQCQWGLFPVKYFFSSAVSDTSKDQVQRQIQEILRENSGKRMSDQKLCDELLKRGVKVARRTVAKYRAQMNIDSSYSR